jgi:hypothetical protein
MAMASHIDVRDLIHDLDARLRALEARMNALHPVPPEPSPYEPPPDGPEPMPDVAPRPRRRYAPGSHDDP